MTTAAVKLSYADETRRVALGEQPLSFEALGALVAATFPQAPRSVALVYRDDEGDVVTVASARELAEAQRLFALVLGKTLHVRVMPRVGVREQLPPAVLHAADELCSAERRPVFYFVGDSITEFGSNPQDSGFIALFQRDYVRCVDMVNRGLAGYNSRWVAQHALPIFDAELAAQYEASFVTLWLGANDAALPNGPNKSQFVPLDEFRGNMTTLARAFAARLPAGGRLLLITPPAVIDSVRRDKDRSNAAAGAYARACVELAAAEQLPVLDLHTHFNRTYPDEQERMSFFADGLHFNAKGNAEVARLLGDKMKELFAKDALDRFHHLQLPGWETWVK